MQKKKSNAKRKCGHEVNFIDLEVRNGFYSSKVTTSMIKCANGLNHCRLQHEMINNNLIDANGLQWNQVEKWDCATKCNETNKLRSKIYYRFSGRISQR